MKIRTIIAAAALGIAAIGASTAANAQDNHGDRDRAGFEHHDGDRHDNDRHDNDRHDDRRNADWRGGGRDNNWNGNHNGWDRHHRHCHNEWHHHHQIRVCG